MKLKMSLPELSAFVAAEFPQVKDDFAIDAVSAEELVLRLRVGEKHLRPGGTVSGPALFGLADVAVYLMVLSRIGPQALAVTTSCSIDFMRKPAAGVDVLATCRLLKLGRTLAVGDVLLRSHGHDAPVARASLTYAIPPAQV
ncbi:PaaI family thioesterase [Roseovarius sp. LXJ103]|uniref:PaaI family thioesterase n=1 Tax=Roseovarius carneus TaxID=2853164 RepID=UPI000D60497A|nr:PaaI family thioesterase [Roseovarius carneus]MBZ8119450.1 PaaI family thioesterase [Roseovarius carneus]PWE34914.1 thioesterase [Pelagicola sp. LXJ1103]